MHAVTGQGTDNVIVTWSDQKVVQSGNVFDALIQYLKPETSLYGVVDTGNDDSRENLSVLLSLIKYSKTANVYLLGKRITQEFFPDYEWDDKRWFDSHIINLVDDANETIAVRFVILPAKLDDSVAEEFFYQCNIKLKGSDFADKIKIHTPEEAAEHFKLIIQAYADGKISHFAFDTETTNLAYHEQKSRITTVSYYDAHTDVAGACVFRHPELYVPELKAAYYKRALIILDRISEMEIWPNKDKIVGWFVDWVKGINGLEFAPHHWVTSIDEDFVIQQMAELGAFFKRLTMRRADPVGSINAHITGEKIYPVILKILHRFDNGVNEERQMTFLKAVSDVLDEVPIGGHNIKFDVGFCLSYNLGKKMRVAYDTLAEVLLVDGVSDYGYKKNDLGSVINRHTAYTSAWKDGMSEDDRVKRPKTGVRYDRVELQKHSTYAATDGIAAEIAHIGLAEKLEGSLAQGMIVPTIYRGLKAFGRAEAFGVSVDESAYRILDQAYTEQISESITRMSSLPIARQVLDSLSIERINPNVYGAPSHCNNVLFSKEGYDLKPIKTTDAGFPSLDKEALPELIEQVEMSIKGYEKWSVEGMVDQNSMPPTNLNKPWQMMDESLVVKMREALEFLKALTDQREVQRLKSTYIGGIAHVEKELGSASAYYDSFNIVGATATGRLSSGFHGMPRKSDIKKLFISSWGSFSTREFDPINAPGTHHKPYPTPESLIELPDEKRIITFKEFRDEEVKKIDFPNRYTRRAVMAEARRGGGILATGDFSQLEVYVCAILSGCKKLLDALAAGWDVHAYVAQQSFPECAGLDLKTIKVFHKEKRSFAKTILFGLLFGKQFQDPEMMKLVDFFFSTFHEIKTWIDSQHRFVEDNGYVITPFGRTRHLPDGMLKSSHDLWKVRAAHRRSVNTPIQSTASDCAFDGCGNIDFECYRRQMLSRFIGGVHDSILVDAYPGELPDVMKIMHKATTQLQFEFMGGYHLNFDLAFGVSWGRQMEIKTMSEVDGGTLFELEGGDVDFEMLKPDLYLAHPGLEIRHFEVGSEFEDRPKREWVPQNRNEVEAKIWIPN